MAKKKKGSNSKGKVNDARGYVSSSNTNVAAPQQAPVISQTTTPQLRRGPTTTTSQPIPNQKQHLTTTTSESSASYDRIIMTPEIYQISLELLRALFNHQQLLLATTTNDTSNSVNDISKRIMNSARDRPPLIAMENNRHHRNSTTTTQQDGFMDTTKLRRRLGTLYDTLTGYGFHVDQIMECIQSISESFQHNNNSTSMCITLSFALDWLCYYIPPTELPPLFTESILRSGTDNNMNNQRKVTSSLSFIRPTTITDQSAQPASSPQTWLPPPNIIDNTTSNNKINTSEQQWRERLMEQYQYEVEYDDDDCNGNIKNVNCCLRDIRTGRIDGEAEDQSGLVSGIRELDVNTVTNELGYFTVNSDDDNVNANVDTDHCSNKQVMEEKTPMDAQIDVPLSCEQPVLVEETSNSEPIAVRCHDGDDDGDDVRLRDMKLELQTLEEDSNNDANNYMRGKQEVKELKSKISQLRKQVSSLEAKGQRRRMVQTKEVVREQHGDSDEEETGMFSMFDDVMNQSQETTVSIKQKSKSTKVEFPDDAIPLNWTGKTPKEYLDELCRKEKYPRPTFRQLPRNGCQLTVKYSHGDIISLEEHGPYSNYTYVQNYLSTKALYQIQPTLPLHRIFPHFYRHLWLTWENTVKQNQEYEASLIEQSRQKIIDELFLIVTGTRTSTLPEVNTSGALGAKSQQSSHNREAYKPDAKRTKIINLEKGKLLKERFLHRKESLPYQALLSDRKNLPIYSCRDEILGTIQNNPVTILCAETGSGKTTQCCSFILESAFMEGYGDITSILCTQPRRVAAISVAERVAEEWGEESVGKLIGYQIRMEAKRNSETRILFCTTGVILRRLIEDKELNGISHVVLDEVHERQWQIDILLVALRALINGPRPDLKIVLMSATLDKKLFGTFFTGAPLVNVPGRTFPVRTFYLEDLLEHTNHVIEEGSRNAHRINHFKNTTSIQVKSRQMTTTYEYTENDEVSENYIAYNLETRKSMDRVDETVINYDLIEDVLHEIFFQKFTVFTPSTSVEMFGSATGAVLIFLPGIGEIRTLTERLSGSKKFGDRNRFDIVPLHSSLSSTEQKRAFITSTITRRKIIISTNIAETSVTIPDVVYVIDSGRFREITRDRRNDSRKLIVSWCSKASAEQRSGRAGRIQAGVCLKLYSSLTESQVMKMSTEPELQRIPLEEVCLTILAGGFGVSCANFLSQTPQRPTEDAIQSALTVLEDIGAIESFTPFGTDPSVAGNETLTSLGRLLAKLPVDAKVGKMLILGSIFNCTDAILTIAATLSSSKSPFMTSFEDRQDFQAIQRQFFSPFSDFLTFVNVWNAYRQADSVGAGKKFCHDKRLNYFTMIEIQDSRRHFFDLLVGLGFVSFEYGGLDDREWESNKHNRNCRSEQLVHALVFAGLFPNVAMYSKSNSKTNTFAYHKSEQLFIQSSVNSKMTMSPPSSWIVYSEKFGTERRVSISKTAFVLPICLILFGSQLQVFHTERKVRIDNWVDLSTPASTAVVFREIQNRLSDVLFSLFNDSNRAKNKSALSNSVEVVVGLVGNLLHASQH